MSPDISARPRTLRPTGRRPARQRQLALIRDSGRSPANSVPLTEQPHGDGPGRSREWVGVTARGPALVPALVATGSARTQRVINGMTEQVPGRAGSGGSRWPRSSTTWIGYFRRRGHLVSVLAALGVPGGQSADERAASLTAHRAHWSWMLPPTIAGPQRDEITLCASTTAPRCGSGSARGRRVRLFARVPENFTPHTISTAALAWEKPPSRQIPHLLLGYHRTTAQSGVTWNPVRHRIVTPAWLGPPERPAAAAGSKARHPAYSVRRHGPASVT